MTPTKAALAERAGTAAAALLPVGRALPTPLLDTYQAVMTSRIVMAATRLGVFAALAEAPADSAAVAEHAGIEPAGADVLLVALESLGYVRSSAGGEYRLTATARRWLGPCQLARVVGEFVYDDWEHFSRLEDVLRGAPPEGLHDRDPGDPYWQRYQLGMHALARQSAPAVARAIRVRSPQRLLDVGGGPGSHAVAMCRRHRDLEATVVDLEPAAEIGRELVALEGLGDRIHYRTGDALEVELGSGYDVVTIHNVLHNLAPARSAQLVARAVAALRPGGTVAIFEIERPPPGRAGPRLAGALGVLMWILQHTRTYSATELRGWLDAAGCRRIRLKRITTLPGTVLALGRAPRAPVTPGAA
jgi:2-polyprenyl-3-methyl-5-hydroxy-6-metoxy-1,4-benzoquinol methylase